MSSKKVKRKLYTGWEWISSLSSLDELTDAHVATAYGLDWPTCTGECSWEVFLILSCVKCDTCDAGCRARWRVLSQSSCLDSDRLADIG